MVERPDLIKVVSNVKADLLPEVVVSYHFLYIFAHAFHMHQRKYWDNEWAVVMMEKTSFEHGQINEIWKNNIELEKWFDSAF